MKAPAERTLNTRSGKSRGLIRLMTTVAVPLMVAACTTTGGEAPSSAGAGPSAQMSPGVARVSHEISSREDNSFLNLAREMVAQGDHNAAIPLFRRAHKWHPFSSEPLVGLGQSLSAVGQYPDALEAFQKAVDRNEENIEALKGLGKVYLALSRPTMAVPVLNKAVRLAPTDGDAISHLALALELQGHKQAALEVYRDGLEIDPDNLKLLNNYGLSLALQSRHDEAIRILKQAAQHKGADATHRQNLAMAYALAGNEMMAARLLSIDSGPELTDDNLNYYRVLANMPAEKRFDQVLRRSVSAKKDLEEPGYESFKDDSLTKNMTVARLVEEKPEPVAVVVPAPEPEPEDPSVPPLLGPEGWALQIAAYRKKSELRPGWEKLKKKYEDIIGHLEPRRSEVDFGDRGGKQPSGFYYRLNAGPLTSYEEANEACRKIRERGTDCWVRPPEKSEGKIPETDLEKAKPFRVLDQNDMVKETPQQQPSADPYEIPDQDAGEKPQKEVIDAETSATVTASPEDGEKARAIVWKLFRDSGIPEQDQQTAEASPETVHSDAAVEPALEEEDPQGAPTEEGGPEEGDSEE